MPSRARSCIWSLLCTRVWKYSLIWSSVNDTTVTFGSISSNQPTKVRCLRSPPSTQTSCNAACSVGTCPCSQSISNSDRLRSLKNFATCKKQTEELAWWMALKQKLLPAREHLQGSSKRNLYHLECLFLTNDERWVVHGEVTATYVISCPFSDIRYAIVRNLYDQLTTTSVVCLRVFNSIQIKLVAYLFYTINLGRRCWREPYSNAMWAYVDITLITANICTLSSNHQWQSGIFDIVIKSWGWQFGSHVWIAAFKWWPDRCHSLRGHPRVLSPHPQNIVMSSGAYQPHPFLLQGLWSSVRL